MHIANILTVIRAALAISVAYLLIASPVKYSFSYAFILFLAGMATDYLDGLWARRKERVTNFGKIMDPLADKLLVLSTLFAFACLGIIRLWMVGLIALREIVISIMRIHYLLRGRVMAAERAGKHKTFSQMLAILLIFIAVVYFYDFTDTALPRNLKNLADLLILAVVVITLYSGVIYLKNSKLRK
jgi:CDP-diacylglycerol---glycerol-3-phosphate 3-phosphatidyltransferase